MYKEDLYNAIYERFTTDADVTAVFNALGLVKPKYISLYYGQLERPDLIAPFTTPAIFVEFVRLSDFRNIAQNSQQGTLDFRLYLVQTTIANGAHNVANANEKQIHLNLLRMSEAVHYALAQLSGELFGKCLRTQEEGLLFNGVAYITTIDYKCSVRDNIANYLKQALQAAPDSYQIDK